MHGITEIIHTYILVVFHLEVYFRDVMILAVDRMDLVIYF
jgi:hypothetical protein